jgi:hypothetical protein
MKPKPEPQTTKQQETIVEKLKEPRAPDMQKTNRNHNCRNFLRTLKTRWHRDTTNQTVLPEEDSTIMFVDVQF